MLGYNKRKRNMEYVIESFRNRKYLSLPKLIRRTGRLNCVDNGLKKHLNKKEILSAIKRAEKKGFIARIPDPICKLYEFIRKC